MVIRTDEDKPLTEELIINLSGYVLDKTGYDVRFVEKELDTTISLDEYEYEGIAIENSITYYKDKEEFEKFSLYKGKYEIQSKDGMIQSYEHIKSFVKVSYHDKDKLRKFHLLRLGLMT